AVLDAAAAEKIAGIKEFKKLKDSKLVPEKKREEFFELIMNNFTEVGVGICDHETIDRLNIYQATFLCMKKALGALKKKPDYIMLDGRAPIPNFSLKQENIVDGDNLVFSIAAASIIAKVTHDRLIAELAEKYPQYGFANHKGYGTKEHLDALIKYGPTPFHRKTFGPVKNLLKKTP
ncbi:MAG TPA: ribonuclease HII, partial [Candidatus Nanoarchaeia archaeon]|nr:ribonuclease HII [Candidatus Nanoarchaeia archaeon]